METSKLCPISFGLGLGLVSGLWVFLYSLLLVYFLQGKPIVAHINNAYFGYTPTVLTSLSHGIIVFVHAFIGGFFLALFYNFFHGRLHPCKKACKS